MTENELDHGVMRMFVELLREHIDFLDEVGLRDEFRLWVDKRYRDPDDMDESEA
jgi:hypothetical protein